MWNNTGKRSVAATMTYKQSKILWGYLLIAPLMLGLGFFWLYPFFQNIFYSFTNLGAFGRFTEVSAANYIRLTRDPYLLKALTNTLFYAVFSVPASIITALLLAVLLNTKIKGRSMYRTLYFLPHVTIPTVVGLVWLILLNSEYGLINGALASFNIPKVKWLIDAGIVKISVSTIVIWQSVGYNMVILLAGLQNIPKTYYEAATIDGAAPPQRFFRITLPLVTPSLFFVLVLQIIGVFQIFDQIFTLLPMQSVGMENAMSMTVLYYFYGFFNIEKGYAAAIALTLFLMIMAVTLIQFRAQKKWVHY